MIEGAITMDAEEALTLENLTYKAIGLYLAGVDTSSSGFIAKLCVLSQVRVWGWGGGGGGAFEPALECCFGCLSDGVLRGEW